MHENRATRSHGPPETAKGRCRGRTGTVAGLERSAVLCNCYEVLTQRRQSHRIDGVDISLPVLCDRDNRAVSKVLAAGAHIRRAMVGRVKEISAFFVVCAQAMIRRFLRSGSGHLGWPKTLSCVAYCRAYPCSSSGPSHHSPSALETILKQKQRLQPIKLCAKQQRMPHFRYQSFTTSAVSIWT